MTNDEIYQARLTAYAALVASIPELELKGKKMPYTSMNGNMFSFLTPEGLLCFRLATTDCKAFLEAYDAEPVKQYGSVMRDYVGVPDAVLEDAVALNNLFIQCVTNAKSLKAKPTKR